MALTDKMIRSLEASSRPTRHSDGAGLYLEVSPTGAKLWRYKYRYGGVEKRCALGQYPDVGLAEARRRRDQVRRQVEKGVDPSAERKRIKLTRALAAADTFGDLAQEFICVKFEAEGRAQITIDKARWIAEQFTPIAKLPISDIKPIDILAVLKKLETAGKRETASRCRSFASRVFRYAVATSRAESDPAALLQGALATPRVKHHAALLDPKDVGALLRGIELYTGSVITKFAMLIAPHVMTRPGELRQAEWREFDFERAVWNVPIERMKVRRPHTVPLSRQVIDYLRELYPLTGPRGFVFPAVHTFKRPMCENTINQAFRRMGYTTDEVTAHGLRTTASSLLNESGLWSPDAIERSLAHGDTDAIRGIYNRGRYWDERVEMHQWWSDYLDKLRDGKGDLRPWAQEKTAPPKPFRQNASPPQLAIPANDH